MRVSIPGRTVGLLLLVGLALGCASVPRLPGIAAGQPDGPCLLAFQTSSDQMGISTSVNLSIVDSGGREIRKLMILPETRIHLVGDLKPGTYSFVQASANSIPSVTKKFVIGSMDFTLSPGRFVLLKQAFRFGAGIIRGIDLGNLNINDLIGDPNEPPDKRPGAQPKPWRMFIPSTGGGSAKMGDADMDEFMMLLPVMEYEERAMLEGFRSQPAARQWKYEPIHPANAPLAREVFRGE